MRMLSLAILGAASAASLVACTPIEKEKKPVPPQSSASRMPWNTPVAGQGQGQFGMLPGMNQRR
jgi:hypothetical protein